MRYGFIVDRKIDKACCDLCDFKLSPWKDCLRNAKAHNMRPATADSMEFQEIVSESRKLPALPHHPYCAVEQRLVVVFLAQAIIRAQVVATVKTYHLPSVVAKELVRLSIHLGLPPMLTYTDCVLMNTCDPALLETFAQEFFRDGEEWTETKQDAAERIAGMVKYTFTDEMHERWFMAVHQIIEVTFGPAARSLIASSSADVMAKLSKLKETLPKIELFMGSSFMQRLCSPEEFWNILRPVLCSWPKEGVFFEDVPVADMKAYWSWSYVSGNRFHFDGPTGAQSPIFMLLDQTLKPKSLWSKLGLCSGGISSKFKRYIQASHATQVFSAASLREAVETLAAPQQTRRLDLAKKAYNEAVDALVRIREQHYKFVRIYISQALQGTGGMDPTIFLRWKIQRTISWRMTAAGLRLECSIVKEGSVASRLLLSKLIAWPSWQRVWREELLFWVSLSALFAFCVLIHYVVKDSLV